jgi:hypothetical protein
MWHAILRLLGAVSVVLGAITLQWPYLSLEVAWPLLIIGAILICAELPGLVRDSRKLIQRLRLRGPIVWNLQQFLGVSRREGELAYVSCFQVSGFNKGRRAIRVISAVLRSQVTGRSIPVRFKTDHGYVGASEIHPVPKGATIFAQALFYDPLTQSEGNKQGLSEDEFMSDWGEFEFLVTYENGKFKRSFGCKDTARQIAAVKPPTKTRPRVTRVGA